MSAKQAFERTWRLLEELSSEGGLRRSGSVPSVASERSFSGEIMFRRQMDGTLHQPSLLFNRANSTDGGGGAGSGQLALAKKKSSSYCAPELRPARSSSSDRSVRVQRRLDTMKATMGRSGSANCFGNQAAYAGLGAALPAPHPAQLRSAVLQERLDNVRSTGGRQCSASLNCFGNQADSDLPLTPNNAVAGPNAGDVPIHAPAGVTLAYHVTPTPSNFPQPSYTLRPALYFP